MYTPRFLLSTWIAPFALLLLTAATTRAEDGAVKGKVTVDGKPLTAGRIFFHLDNDQFVGAKVKNGEFTLDRVPAGTHRITVEGDGVPAVYGAEDKTPLRADVKAGDNNHDIELRAPGGAEPKLAGGLQADAAKPEDARLKDLLKEKVATLKEIAAQVETTVQSGRAPVEELYQARRAVLQAQLDLSETDKEQIAILEEAVALARKQEEQVSQRAKSGRVPPGDVLRARVNRLEAEIALERAKSPKQAPPGDVKKRAAQAGSDVAMWLERVAWAERMARKGYLTERQVRADKAKLKKAQAERDEAERELKRLPPS